MHELGLRVVLAADEAEHLVALAGEELGQVPAVLAGDAGDERSFHGAATATAAGRSGRSQAGSSWWRNSAQRCGLVGLADARRRPRRRPASARRNPRLVSWSPPHVARAAPAGLAQPVEAAVVADPEARVRLDVVAGELAEPGPAVEEPGPARDDGGDRVAARVRSGAASAARERGERVGGLGVEHRLGRTPSGDEVDRAGRSPAGA